MSFRRSARRFATTVLPLALLLAPSSVARAKPAPKVHPSRSRLTACQVPGDEGKPVDALCGVYEVWENRAAKAGRKIGLKVVLLPALAAQPKPDPIFFFGGGPGEAIAEEAGGAAGDPTRQDRDFVFVNQRGTGEPSKLGCDLGGRLDDPQSYLGETFPLAAVERCRDELMQRADLTLYGTDTAMDDIDEVRSWLGYGKINLLGGSYGTRAVQTYLRRHGETVRAAVLQGVVPMPETLPLSHAAGAQRSIELLFSWCDKDPACHGKFPRVHEEFAAIMDQLAQNPVEADVKMPGAEKPIHVRLARGVMADGVRWMLYTPRTGALLPLLIHEAAAGNWGPLGQAAVASRIGVIRGLAMGMFFSVTCSEDVALIDPATIAARNAGTFLGDYRVRQQIAACALWPHFRIAPETKLLFRSELPILLISGERDPVTPPAFGDLARRGYTHSLHLVFPYGSHGIDGDCVDRVQREFIARGGFDGLDTSCVAETTLTPFVLELPQQISGPLG